MTGQVSHQEVGQNTLGATKEVGEITGGVQAEVDVVAEVEAGQEGVGEVADGIKVETRNLRKMILVLVMKMAILTWSQAQKDLKRDCKFQLKKDTKINKILHISLWPC